MTEQWPAPSVEPEVLTSGTGRRRGRGFAIGTACVAGGVAFGIVGIAAATGTPHSTERNQLAPAAQAQSVTPSPSASPAPGAPVPGAPAPGRRPMPGNGGPQLGGPGMGGPGMGGRGFGGVKGIGGGVLHGEFVMPKPGGGYQTIQVQNGTATAVSATSITVKSADGFSRTYAADKDTLVNAGRDGITSIAVNDAVTLRAIGAGDKATVSDVVDETKLTANRGKFAPKRETPSPNVSKSTA